MPQPFCQSARYRKTNLYAIAALSEDEAFEKLLELRWGSRDTVVCPDCGAVDRHYFRRDRRRWRCKHCDADFSLTSGTPLQDHKLSFHKLLFAIMMFVSSPKGLSANALHAELDVTPRTAWLLQQKLREALFETQDLTPLDGTVHVDGGHFCGKPRRPRVRQKMTSAMVNHRLRNRKASMVPPGVAGPMTPWNAAKFKNRRIVLAMRKMSPINGYGAERTIVAVVPAETRAHVLPVVRKYVDPGATIMTDDSGAYSWLSAYFADHKTVCHSTEYSTKAGVNNNGAESYMARLRRSEYGVFHGMRPQYFAFYVMETAWREDVRRNTLDEKLQDVTSRLFRAGLSKAWRGYRQGQRLGKEYIG